MSKQHQEIADAVTKSVSKRIFENRELLTKAPNGLDVILIFDTLETLLQRTFARQNLRLKKEPLTVDDNNIYAFEIENGAKEVVLKGKIVILPAHDLASVNVLETHSGDENLLTSEVKLMKEKSMEETVLKIVQSLDADVIQKLKFAPNSKQESTQNREGVRADPLFIGGGIGGGLGRPAPGFGGRVPGYGGPGFGGPGFGGPGLGGPGFGGPGFGGPNIRIDPVYPPGLGIRPEPDPDHFLPPRFDNSPDYGGPTPPGFPVIGGPYGDLVGPNNPAFRGRNPESNFNPRLGGPERGNFGSRFEDNISSAPQYQNNEQNSQRTVSETQSLSQVSTEAVHGSTSHSNESSPANSAPLNFGRRVDRQPDLSPINPQTFMKK